jgi:Txe/YoeB family toxin of toxin-antitoxin system
MIISFGRKPIKRFFVVSIPSSKKRNPFEGIGKPEPLKHALSGYWSRRITDEHRFVYKVSENAIHIAQLRYHY